MLTYTITSILFLSAIILNYKSLPLVYFVRLFLRVFLSLRRRPWTTSTDTSSTTISDSPLTQPTAFTSICTIGEIDHNLHKSNSTFLADMDISRAKLLSRLLSPALLRPGSENILSVLTSQGHWGRFGVVLGAVHVSFCREIGVGQMYRVESRIATWTRKWIVIETDFWRDGAKGEQVLLAKGVSKMVFKKGRFTVPVEMMLKAAGLTDGVMKESVVCSSLMDQEKTSELKMSSEVHEAWLKLTDVLMGGS